MSGVAGRKRRPGLAALFAIARLAIAAAIAISSWSIDGHWWEFALLTVGAIAGGVFEVQVGPRSYISEIFVFSVMAAAFLGPTAAFLTPVIAFAVAGPVHHARRLAILGNCAGSALPNVLGALLLQAWLPSDLTTVGTPVAIVAVSILMWPMNVGLNGVHYALLDGIPIAAHVGGLVRHAPGILASCVFAGTVGAVYAQSPAAGLAFTYALMAAMHYTTWQTASALERAHEIARLAASRRALAADAAQAEERERRRIAERLHDDVLQTLLAARQDIVSGTRGDGERLRAAEAAVVEAVSALRQNVAQLHPAPTHAAGLATMVHAVAEAEARRGGFDVEVSVAPDLGDSHDRLLIGVVRELLVNVTRHADAKDVRVDAHAEDGRVVLAVADDGRGMTPDDRGRALAAGHVGLASITERVEALDGSVTITSPASGDRGTTVSVSLPRAP